MGKELAILYNFEKKLDEDFSWRRKELSVFVNKIPTTSGPLQSVMLRSGMALLYSHWEGFIKISMSYYLEHVAQKYLKNNVLNAKFLTLSLQNRLGELATNDFESKTKIIECLFSEYNKRSNIPKKNIINTKSNLRYPVLAEILYILDLEDSYIEKHESTINDLVDTRNHIAHGEYNIVSHDTFKEFYNDIVELMIYLMNKIKKSAEAKSYETTQPLITLVI